MCNSSHQQHRELQCRHNPLAPPCSPREGEKEKENEKEKKEKEKEKKREKEKEKEKEKELLVTLVVSKRSLINLLWSPFSTNSSMVICPSPSTSTAFLADRELMEQSTWNLF